MINKMMGCFALVGTLAVTATPASAANNLDTMNPWTDCGIGAMIFKNDVAAAISNIIWDLGTTAVTSAVSSKGSCSGNEAKAALIINETYPALADETAKGQGQNLSAVLSVLGCDAKKEADVIAAIRADFTQLVTAPDYTSQSQVTKAQNYYGIVKTTTNAQCTAS